ncbi:MAG: TonB-dependent receptor [Bacteroidetes bacterium]|nr:TonB-dependent receptor [Bacteroidota bacterium]
MNKLLLLLILVFVSFEPISAQQDSLHEMNEVVVSAARVPLTFSDLARTVIVLDGNTIQTLPTDNIQDLLKYVGGVDLKLRGVEGVQGDISIRGGTSEQTLILIDGIKLSDPQTSHHNLNLPVTLENIERIEILKGQGSRIYGPNAFSGAVNIITKKERLPSLGISMLGGEHNLFETNFSASYPVGITNNTVSVSKKKSDGYTFNTAFDITNFFLQQSTELGGNNINVMFGYDDKKFGANSFYSNLFPNQWEHTTTKLLAGTADLQAGILILSPKVYWRRNDDDFFLDHNRPDWNRNIHQTNSYGGEIQSSVKSSIGTTTFGGEFAEDEIASTNIGDHTRTKGGFFAEQVIEPLKNFSSSFGMFAYNYSGIGWKFWPSIDAAYHFSGHAKIYGSIGKAFRIPTFTDLYYVSPANIGNPNLTYEETTNYELGFSFLESFFEAGTSIFLNDGHNLIDWVRSSSSAPWIVQNVTNVKTYGVEFNTNVDLRKLIDYPILRTIGVSYTYLTVNRETGNYQSKYLLDHLKHQFIINLTNILPFEIFQSWSLRYEDRQNFQSHFILDTQIVKHFGDFELLFRANNLFNKTYSDFPGVLLPGRWVSVGLKYSYL